MLPFLREKAVLLNSQFQEHAQDISHLRERLEHDIELLDFSPEDLQDARDYLRDHVTLFRYLSGSQFDETKAHERLLDTIRWRQEKGVARMTYESVANEFFDDGGFAFFHKQDRLGRPIAIVRMRYFPQFRDKSATLTELMQPYACLVMEMVRKIMLDITCNNQYQGDPCPLVSQMAVVIDIGKAPFIPVDAQLVRSIMDIMDNRFPGSMGSIYVMNFGWMYQGLWQMVKFIISEEARSRISFPSAKEMTDFIAPENLLKELGGEDDFEWSMEKDTALHEYGTGKPATGPSLVEPSPDLRSTSPPLSIRPSRSTSISSDEFFDANDIFSTTPFSSLSQYATPGTMTPVLAQQQQQQVAWFSAMPPNKSRNFYHWTGLHMGTAFLTSFLGYPHQRQQPYTFTSEELSMGIDGLLLADRLATVKEDQEQFMLLEGHEVAEFKRHTPHFPHLLPPDVPQSAYALSPLRVQMQRIEQRVIRWTRRIFRLSFAYKGAIYWVVLYIFLRGPVEHVLRRSLTMFVSTPQKIAYTTVGITAAVAAAIGTSVTGSLERPRKD
ncbi:major sperm protein [Lichtheimia corymbifera JMRC:FSU:9682]|uniref:Major sperm protein n=1 Tax=Lichtheimia corymbifera JMRC:FSU:9682 TaxID=1263082 RepID=A0A068RJ40_9FUNG|nr:major sperm protein [Lichtheimia corymbifera JMRC:FSU:9682]